MKLATILAVFACVAVAVYASEDKPTAVALPKAVDTDSDIHVIKALKVVAARIARGKVGTQSGGKLMAAFLERRAEKLASRMGLIKRELKQLKSVKKEAEDDIANSEQIAKEIKQYIPKLKKLIRSGVADDDESKRFLAEVSSFLTQHTEELKGMKDDVALVEEASESLPYHAERNDAEGQALEAKEKSAQAALEALRAARSKARDDYARAVKKVRQQKLIAMQAELKRLEYIASVHEKKIARSKATIEKIAKRRTVLIKAAKRHKNLAQVVRDLKQELIALNKEKVIVYSKQLAAINKVADMLQLGVDITAWAAKTSKKELKAHSKAVKAEKAFKDLAH